MNGISFLGCLLILAGCRHKDVDTGKEMTAITGSELWVFESSWELFKSTRASPPKPSCSCSGLWLGWASVQWAAGRRSTGLDDRCPLRASHLPRRSHCGQGCWHDLGKPLIKHWSIYGHAQIPSAGIHLLPGPQLCTCCSAVALTLTLWNPVTPAWC